MPHPSARKLGKTENYRLDSLISVPGRIVACLHLGSISQYMVNKLILKVKVHLTRVCIPNLFFFCGKKAGYMNDRRIFYFLSLLRL